MPAKKTAEFTVSERIVLRMELIHLRTGDGVEAVVAEFERPGRNGKFQKTWTLDQGYMSPGLLRDLMGYVESCTNDAALLWYGVQLPLPMT